MTALRIRMIEDMQLRGFSERTQEAYVRAVRQLAAHYHKSPEQITEEEIRQYFLYNKNIRKWSRSASTIALCGIKFLYSHTLEKEWTTFTLVRPPKENKLPPILSRKEVRRIFNSIKMAYHRVCLITIYNSSEYLHDFYKRKRGGRRAGKARVAVARKVFTYMYQMLKKDEYYRWMDEKNHARKMSEYRSFLKRKGSDAEMKKSA